MFNKESSIFIIKLKYIFLHKTKDIKKKTKMQVDLSEFTSITPKEFILQGKRFVVKQVFSKGKTIISVLCYIALEDGVYTLYIKGDYERGSTAKIQIGNGNSTLTQMYLIATDCIIKCVPEMVIEDYPESLKKIALTQAAATTTATKKVNNK